MMSPKQSLALWELCRQGLPLLAETAKERWEEGKHFDLTHDFGLARSVKALIDECNWEIDRSIEAV